MPLVKSVRTFDPMGTIAAALLTQMHDPQQIFTRRYKVIHEDDSYQLHERANPFSKFTTCVGYALADGDATLGEDKQLVPLNHRDGGVQNESWVNFDNNANQKFHPFELDHTRPHYDAHYNPQDIRAVVVFDVADQNDPKAGFRVTELQKGYEDYTRDWVIKQRAPHISEIEAFKLVTFKGRCTIVEAAQWIHLLNQPRHESD